jgi:peptide deformylase
MLNILKILRMGHPVLRQVAEPFSKEEITSSKTRDLVSAMVRTMRSVGGLGLAAPQIGNEFVLSLSMLSSIYIQFLLLSYDTPNYFVFFKGVSKQLVIIEVPSDLSENIQPLPLTVIFNPQLGTKRKKAKQSKPKQSFHSHYFEYYHPWFVDFPFQHEKIQMWESCLSIPGLVGKVTRYNNVIMNFIGDDAKKRRLAATGYNRSVLSPFFSRDQLTVL